MALSSISSSAQIQARISVPVIDPVITYPLKIGFENLDNGNVFNEIGGGTGTFNVIGDCIKTGLPATGTYFFKNDPFNIANCAETPASVPFNLPKPFTICIFFKCDGNPSNESLYSIFSAGQDSFAYYSIKIANTTAMVCRWGANQTTFTGTFSAGSGWQHFAMTMDNSNNAKLYLNGSLANSATRSISNNTFNRCRIGSGPYQDSYDASFYKACQNVSVDDFRIYNSVLTASEILAIKNEKID